MSAARAMIRTERQRQATQDRQREKAHALIICALVDNGPMTAGQAFVYLRGRIPWPLLRIYLDQLRRAGRVASDMTNGPGAIRSVRDRIQSTHSVPAGDLVSRVIGGA